MCNEIGCSLKIYEDTILPFEDTSGAVAAVHQKVPFEDTSGAAAAAAAQRNIDKDVSDASSQASKEFSNRIRY